MKSLFGLFIYDFEMALALIIRIENIYDEFLTYQ